MAVAPFLTEFGVIMQLVHLIYTSQPFGYDDPTLGAILTAARHFNQRDSITGCLICREDIFLQLLEGPADVVNAAYARISRDGRHVGVVKLFAGDIAARMFPDWDMKHDPARSWMWTPAQVEMGAVRRASADEVLAVFRRVANEPGAMAARVL